MKQIKAIVSDLDGTLLNTHHTFSDYTQSVFKELYNQNYLIIIATGRHHLDAMPLVEKLGIPVYLVTSNGARIHSPQKELLFSFNMKSDAVKAIFSLDIDPEITTVLFRENVWQTSKHNEKLNRFQRELTYHPELVDFSTLKDYEAIKIFFTHESHDKLVTVRDTILRKYPNVFNHAFSLPLCLEFMDKSVDKSVAISRIVERECLGLNQTIAFGDGFNDELMLAKVHKGLIMQNAPNALKEKLSHLEIIDTNDDNGVAKYLNQKLLSGLLV